MGEYEKSVGAVMIKKVFLIVGVMVLVAGVFGYYFLTNRQNAESTTENKKTKIQTISSQKPIKSRSNFNLVLESDQVMKWGFGVIGDDIFYLDEENSIVRQNVQTGNTKKIFDLKEDFHSATFVGNQGAVMVQTFSKEKINSRLISENSIKELSVECTEAVIDTLSGFIAKTTDGSVFIDNAGDTANISKHGLIENNRLEEVICTSLGYDREVQEGEVVCADSGRKIFTRNFLSLSKVKSNNSTVFITTTEDARGLGILYGKSGTEITRVDGIDTSIISATDEGFYIVSKPTKFEDIENENNGLAFVSNDGTINTILDSTATGKFSVTNVIVSNNRLYIQEGRRIYRLDLSSQGV